jgi:predicted dehydrogenase
VTREVRLGLIGLGNWGDRVARCVHRIPGTVLRSCYARDSRRRERFAADHGCAPATTLDMFLDDDELDAVMIATPHSTHVELITAAASASKHTLVEKPMTLSVEDARRCIEATNVAGVILQVNHFRRWAPATRALKALVDDGSIGEIQQLEGYFSRPVGQDPMAGWRDDPSEAPAGGMTALGVHMVDNLQYLAGPIARLSALSKRTLGRGRIDDVTSVLLEFETGSLGYLGTSLVVPKVATTTVLGTNAAAWSTDDGERLLIQRRDEETRRELPVQPSDPVHTSIADFVRCIRENTRPETGAAEGFHVVAVLEAIIKSSSANGGFVEVDQVSERSTMSSPP